MAQRAEDRIGTRVEVLVEDARENVGRASHQGPETDGVVRLTAPAQRGRFVTAMVTDSEGIDLIGDVISEAW